MKTKQAIFAAAIILSLSCGNTPSGGAELPALGFYARPAEVVSRLARAPREPREHFMLGIAYKSEKKYKDAIFHFANSCFIDHRDQSLRLFPQPVYLFIRGFHFKSDYYDDAVFEIARLFASYGEHAFTVKFADLVSKEMPVLYRDAMLLKARSLSATGKNAEALTVLRGLAGRFDDPESKSLIQIRIGSLLVKDSEYTGSLDAFLEVLKVSTRAWQAATAAQQITAVMAHNPRELKPEERLLYAKALHFSKEYGEAVIQLESEPAAMGDRAETAACLVRSLVRMKSEAKAGALIMEPANAEFRISLTRAMADELWSAGRRDGAMPMYELVFKSREEPHARHALERMGRHMEERRRAGFERCLIEYKDRYSDETAGVFLWLLGRNMIRAKNHSTALVYLEESISSYPRGRQSGECRFWLHRLYTERGLHDRALETARDSVIINPDSPYTWLLLAQLSGTRTEKELGDEYRKRLDAKDEGWALFYHALLMVRQGSLAKGASRIRDLSSPDIARYRDMEKAITGLHTASSHGGALKRIDRYFAVGHLPAVYRELRPLLAEEESRKDRLIALAHYGGKYGHAYLDVYSRLQLLRHFKLKENITLMPEASSRALFPRPFGECADTWAGRHSIRKNILYAVMKAESLFRHNAVSSAGAKGLMQIMPATARGIARSLGMKSFDLTEPCTSIRLGSSYIADLDRQFKGIFPHMVAAYNAGPGNVRKWQDRMAGEDMDYFTEFTPFLETRYYILRTGKFLAQYGLIYPGPNAVK